MAHSTSPRWGKGPYVLADDRRLTDFDVRLYIVLQDYDFQYQKYHKAWPTREELAERLGKGKSTVTTRLNNLEHCGWITIHRRGSSHKWHHIVVHHECIAPDQAPHPYFSESRAKAYGYSPDSGGTNRADAPENETLWLPETVDLPAKTEPGRSVYAGAERSEDTALPTTTHDGRGPANDACDSDRACIDTANGAGPSGAIDDDPWSKVPPAPYAAGWGVNKWTA